MKRVIPIISAALLLIYVNACNTNKTSEDGSLAVDSAAIARGEVTFTQDCSSCHNFVASGIGPQLSGITSAVDLAYIKSFIKDAKSVIESGDERAVNLHDRYKTIMPSFAHYEHETMDDLLAFLATQKRRRNLREADDPNALRNPIPEPIPMSDLVVDMKLLTQIPTSSEEQPSTRITKLNFLPNTDKLFVVDLRGKLYNLQGNKPVVYLDMAAENPNFIHKPGLATGFGSFAFHPDFAENGLLYTSHTEPPATARADFEYPDSIKVTLQWVLSEWKTSQPGSLPFQGKSRELLRVNMVTGIHGMQELTFNPLAKPGDDDYGNLYIGIGDGGSAESGFPFICHDLSRIWGTVLRINPNGTNSNNGNYGIPKTNPFANSDDSTVNKEIYAFGFRNPHRITWDQKGRMLVANIGHHMVESLYIVAPGVDCGWPIREGTFVIDPSQNMYNIYPPAESDGEFQITYPVAQYDHDEGNAIAGGFEYTGNDLAGLKGKYVFGDIVKGRLFYVNIDDLKVGSQAQIHEWQVTLDGVPKTLTQLCGADKVDERFGIDRHGELYITTKPDGRIYKLVSSNNP